MLDNWTILLLVAGTFLVAGLVKGVVGLGLPTVAMGILGLAMTPAQAAGILIVPSLVTNLWQLFAGPSFVALLRRLAGMLIGTVAGTLAGSGVIAGPNARLAAGGLGVALVAYGLFGLAAPRLRVPERHEPWLGPTVGLLTGLVAGSTGVFVIPAVPYLGALGLERDDLIQALGLTFTTSTVALGTALLARGALPAAALGPSALAILPALAGMALGGVLRSRLQPALFRRIFFVGLLVLGTEIAVRALL